MFQKFYNLFIKNKKKVEKYKYMHIKCLIKLCNSIMASRKFSFQIKRNVAIKINTNNI